MCAPGRSRPSTQRSDVSATEGIVNAQQAGNAYLYTFNREHLGAPAIDVLVGIRAELERRLRAEIAGWKIAPAHASLFGSAARGDGDATQRHRCLRRAPCPRCGRRPRMARAAGAAFRPRARLDGKPCRALRGLEERRCPAPTRSPARRGRAASRFGHARRTLAGRAVRSGGMTTRGGRTPDRARWRPSGEGSDRATQLEGHGAVRPHPDHAVAS